MAVERRRLMLTPREVADELRVSTMTIYRMCERGEIESVKVGPKAIRIPRRALDKYFKGLS